MLALPAVTAGNAVMHHAIDVGPIGVLSINSCMTDPCLVGHTSCTVAATCSSGASLSWCTCSVVLKLCVASSAIVSSSQVVLTSGCSGAVAYFAGAM